MSGPQAKARALACSPDTTDRKTVHFHCLEQFANQLSIAVKNETYLDQVSILHPVQTKLS